MARQGGRGPPEPGGCKGYADLGKLYFDEDASIWYECVFEKRWRIFTWAALPPND